MVLSELNSDAKIGGKTKVGAGGKQSKPTRIQLRNRERILDTAISVFASAGFKGATVDQLAKAAGMTKPNLLYYFRTKRDLYIAVLELVLARWVEPLGELDPDGDPAEQILAYMRAKLLMSRERPQDSRLFANEILHGAPLVGDVLRNNLKPLMEEKTRVINGWCKAGKLNRMDPYHLIFMLWATTQHYADFEVQISALLGNDTPEQRFNNAQNTLETILLHGILPK
ncbi:MAG: TetR family transcriptional regulator [Hyphomicrobiales bacterium]|nr:TetR family transcriptional regulator C-terminal domain-containing protein [Hyphomicrobiales bacterium]PCJ83155.1 MAG: TetR family transcriptional regulator [Hyphomicrobiales bacterium]